jgi:hypothetical protein
VPRPRGSGDSRPRPHPGRSRCRSGMQKCPLRPLLLPSLNRSALSSGTPSAADPSARHVPATRLVAHGRSGGIPILTPSTISGVSPSPPPRQSASHRIPASGACNKPIRHIDVHIALFGPASQVVSTNALISGVNLHGHPLPHARPSTLKNMRVAMLPNLHSSCYLPICQSVVSQHPHRQVDSDGLHPRPPMPAAPRIGAATGMSHSE